MCDVHKVCRMCSYIVKRSETDFTGSDTAEKNDDVNFFRNNLGCYKVVSICLR